MISRSASTSYHDAYWSDLKVEDADLNFIYNLLLEREVPLTTSEMVEALIDLRIKQLEKALQDEIDSQHEPYLPANRYALGAVLAFPALNNIVGNVIGLRPGENPDFGEFEVIRVAFDKPAGEREFAAGLADHLLNTPPKPEADLDELTSQEGVRLRYGTALEEKLEIRLKNTEDIVRIAGRWFPDALLADVHVGHLNLAEAVLDVSSGGPLASAELLEHIELPPHLDPLLAEFSLNYAMQEDERFDEVGPAGQVLWFLKRLEPPEVHYAPPRLEYREQSYDPSSLTESLRELELLLDDELSKLAPPSPPLDEVTLPLLFPHWRVGTLPLSARLLPLFPTAYEAPRIRFMLVDGQSGDRFPGWVVRADRYVYGLDDWYRRHGVPAGGLVTVRRSDDPGEVIVEVEQRKRNDWIRTVSISGDSQLGFTMLKQPVGAAYDDLMVIGVMDVNSLDEAWMRGSQRTQSFDRQLSHIFRELAKLNPQSAVHAQSLYSAANVFRRVPPGPVFAELLRRPYYVHVGDLYWRFDDEIWRQS